MEAFLHFCYLGTIPSDIDHGALLALADQYLVRSLAEDCGEALVTSLDNGPEVAAASLIMLYPLRKREGLSDIWKQALARAAKGDQSIVEGRFEALLAHCCGDGQRGVTGA